MLDKRDKRSSTRSMTGILEALEGLKKQANADLVAEMQQVRHGQALLCL